MQCVYNIFGVHVMLCTSCDCRQDHGDAYSDASKGFWLDMMKACSMRGDAGQPALQMAAERLISVHLLYAEELMATSRREHARAEAEALEAQKVRALTTIFSLHTLFVSTVEDCTMCLLAPTPQASSHAALRSGLKLKGLGCCLEPVYSLQSRVAVKHSLTCVCSQ